MANQGLFTQGPSIDDLLAKRNQRASTLQQQLMTNAAQGARDPMKAQAASFLGSSLGRALAGGMDGGDSGREALEAKEAARSASQGEFFQAMQGDSKAAFAMADKLRSTYPEAAVKMINIAQQKKATEDDALKTSNSYEALQSRSAQIGEDLTEWNPELAFRLVSGNATPEEYKEGLSELTAMNKKVNKTGNGNEAKGWQYNDGGVYSDSKGNRYALTNSINKDTNKADILYTPIGDAPAYMNQSLQPTDTTGLTKKQRVAEQTAVYRGKEDMKVFYEHRGTAGSEIGQTTTNLNDANRMLELLTKVNTGGAAVLAGKAVSDFFGTTPADVSELDTISKTVMLGSLKSLLGGQLSDGERAAATEIQVALEKGNEANSRIAQRLAGVFKAKLAREQFVLGNKNTPASYRDFMVQQSIALTKITAPTQATTAPKPQVFQWGQPAPASTGTRSTSPFTWSQ
jgi:hypothetical protein